MGVLEELQAADVHFGNELTALTEEQATFLASIADRLANAPDPAAVAAVTADINAKADALTALADAQRAADPNQPVPGTQDPNQVDPASQARQARQGRQGQ